MGDIAGDGPHDIIYVDHCEIKIWINQNGNAFADALIIDGTPPMTNADGVRMVDLHGTGINGLLWSGDLRVDGRPYYFYLDLCSGTKPHILSEMNNNMGAITKVTYKPSTLYYLEDEKSRDTRWKTRLPFPVQCVACVEVWDTINKNKLVTEYKYRHGYYDGAEREFRGFGRVEQIDTQTFEVYQENPDTLQGYQIEPQHYTPPTKTITWFHQGPVGPGEGDWVVPDYSDEYWQGDQNHLDPFSELDTFLDDYADRRQRRDAHRVLRGSVLRTELYALDQELAGDQASRPYTVSESVYKVREVPVTNDHIDVPLKGISGAIFFPMPSAQRTTQWERGNDPMSQFSLSDDYDEYGQARKQYSIACPRGWRNMNDVFSGDTEEAFLSTLSFTDFVDIHDESVYIKDRSWRNSGYEIVHTDSQSLLDIIEAAKNNNQLNIISQSITKYDGAAFEGAEYGVIESYGLPVRSEQLIITDEILEEAYRDENRNPDIPEYFKESFSWPSYYPQSFRDQLAEKAGYFVPDGNLHHPGYWSITSQTRFDFHDNPNTGKGLPLTQRDALDRDSHIEYDNYQFLPIKVADAIGLESRAEYDYRLYQPNHSVDPNDNVTKYRFTPLGFPRAVFVLGKENVAEGDGWDLNDLDSPSLQYAYDWLAHVNQPGQPISVKTIAREYHKTDTDVPSEKKDDTICTIEYSDGFGRMVQTRTQAEDHMLQIDSDFGNGTISPDASVLGNNTTPSFVKRQDIDPLNVVVSGWQVYNNKGKVVVKYEPFFDRGFEFAEVADHQIGQAVEQFYDPVGRVIRTLNPDLSEQRVIYGDIPDINDPDDFAPTPWIAFTYDENDNAGRTHPTTMSAVEHHWNTPSHIEVDGLGRTIRSVQRNKNPDQNGNNWGPIDEYITASAYDIRGNLLTVTDPQGRIAFRYTYDLTFDEEEGSQIWRNESIDAGLRRIVFDVLGLEIERRDSKGSITLQAYDDINRHTHLWARDQFTLPITLRQNLIFGDQIDAGTSGGSMADRQERNLLGQLYQHYDEAGLVEVVSYDFKGNPSRTTRRVISNDVFSGLLGQNQFQHWQVDWESMDESILEIKPNSDPRIHQSDTTYDALNRPKSITYPEDIAGHRAEVIPSYNRAGALETIKLQSSSSSHDIGASHIFYNAKGQRTLIAYENGLMTRYAYDPQRFWLRRLHTQRFNLDEQDDLLRFVPQNGSRLQDLNYSYDLVGNILNILDQSRQAGVGGSESLDRRFGYDPIYRLISATGREHVSRIPSHNQPWLQDMMPTPNDPNASRAYTQQYRYDRSGNMEVLKHLAQGAAFNRNFLHETDTNRLRSYEQGSTHWNTAYDVNGNMFREATSRAYYWNQSDQLHSFRTEASQGGNVSLEARYLYGADGIRVKKIVWTQGGNIHSSSYIGDVFECQEWNSGENNLLHLMPVGQIGGNHQNRMALLHIGDYRTSNTTDLDKIQYQLADHLGSAHFICNASGSETAREEHYPYGGTSFGGHVQKKYRYTTKERDEESGLNYHEARYYNIAIMKWASCDPLGHLDSYNLFSTLNGNPIKYSDPNGKTTGSQQEVLHISYGADLGTLPEDLGKVKKIITDKDLDKNLKEANILIITGHHWSNNEGKIGDFGKTLEDGKKFGKVLRNLNRNYNNIQLVVFTGCYTLQDPTSIEFFRKIFPNAVIFGYGGSAPLFGSWTILEQVTRRLRSHRNYALAFKEAFKEVVNAMESPEKEIYKNARFNKLLKQAMERKPAVFIPDENKLYRVLKDNKFEIKESKGFKSKLLYQI